MSQFPGQHTPTVKPDKDAQLVERTLHASAIKALIEDRRWLYVKALLSQLGVVAERRAKYARRTPSFDSMVSATFYDGQLAMVEQILREFKRLYKHSVSILEEARTKLPHAPQPRETVSNIGPERDTQREEKNG